MFKKLNDLIGDKLAYWLSTMGMFYGICFLVVAPLFFQRPVGLVSWMQYVVSVFFQGVALPVLGYVARKSGEKQEKLLLETHDVVIKNVESLQSITKVLQDIILDNHEHASEERQQITDILIKIDDAISQLKKQ